MTQGYASPDSQRAADLAAIMVTYGRPSVAITTLRSVLEQSLRPRQICVVDNTGYPAAVRQRADSLCHEHGVSLEWLASPKNLGPAGGYALGVKSLTQGLAPQWLLLVDDDDPLPGGTVVEDLVASAQILINSGHSLGAVGILGSFVTWSGRLSRPSWDERRYCAVDQIGNGRVPIYNFRAIEHVGAMKPELFFGYEELELGLRLRSNGYELFVDGRLRARHEAQLAKAARRPRIGEVPDRGPLWDRSVVNYVRILLTYFTPVRAGLYSLQLLLADGLRFAVAVGTASRPRVALDNLKRAFRSVREAWSAGRLSGVG